MKAMVNNSRARFQPIDITLRVESEEELHNLRALLNHSISVPAALERCKAFDSRVGSPTYALASKAGVGRLLSSMWDRLVVAGVHR